MNRVGDFSASSFYGMFAEKFTDCNRSDEAHKRKTILCTFTTYTYLSTQNLIKRQFPDFKRISERLFVTKMHKMI